jgi:gluconolactonase
LQNKIISQALSSALRAIFPAAAFFLAGAVAFSQSQPGSNHMSVVERLDPALDAIVSSDAQWTTLASGYKWTEGPVWIPSGHYLLFAEIPSNSIRKLIPGQPAAVWLQPSGYRGTEPYGGPEPGTNGMTLDPKGRLTVAGHAARNIQRFETLDPHGPITVLADNYQGQPLNSPNDLVYGPDGSLYFTDPPYGLRKQNETDPDKKLPFSGVFRIPDASNIPVGQKVQNIQLLIRDLPRPNGIAFSPDGKTLYVNNTEPKFWMKYDVGPTGVLGPGTRFLDASSDHAAGAPDGMKVDIQGNIYSTGPGGIWIISPSGKHLGTLHTSAASSNIAWGGPDARTMFVTCSGQVFSIHVTIPGLLPNQWILHPLKYSAK